VISLTLGKLPEEIAAICVFSLSPPFLEDLVRGLEEIAEDLPPRIAAILGEALAELLFGAGKRCDKEILTWEFGDRVVTRRAKFILTVGNKITGLFVLQ